MKEYVKNTKKEVENMKEYVKNMEEYEEILDLALPYLYGSWDLEKFRTPPSYSLWDLEKFRILPLYVWALGLGKFHAGASSWALGLGKIPHRSLLLGSET